MYKLTWVSLGVAANSTLSNQQTMSAPTAVPSLKPSLNNHLEILFVGYSPGIFSTEQGHHYADHTNNFWKLFNESNVLKATLTSQGIDPSSDPVVAKLLQSGVGPADDYGLIKFNIGFTDLIPRAATSNTYVPTEQSLDAVTRLLEEFNESNAQYIVLIGKEVWAAIADYVARQLGVKVTLDAENFKWGLQRPAAVADEGAYAVLEYFYKSFSKLKNLYVFPGTSGVDLDAPYADQLALWKDWVYGKR